jgi:hypothetical protein
VPPALVELLDWMEIKHKGTLASIVQATQKKWLRPYGKERWETPEVAEEKRAKIVELAEKLGFISEIAPIRKKSATCLIHGGTVSRMQLRISYLGALWEEGVRFDRLIFLTGGRPLDPAIEGDDCLLESQAARRLWQEALLPPALKSFPLTFIDVPMKVSEGRAKRPTTADTLIAWLSTQPQVGPALFISSQPFCLYQHLVAKTHLPSSFEPETVGLGGEMETQHGGIILDSIARWLFEQTRSEYQGDLRGKEE